DVYKRQGNYLVGRFDGRVFTPESGPHRFSWGNCFYASQTFNNVPAQDGRRIQIAWGTIENPDPQYNQQMLFPVELTLRTTESGPRLFAWPVKEIEKIHGDGWRWEKLSVGPGETRLAGVEGELFDIIADLHVGTAAEVGIVARGTTLTYNAALQELSCSGCTAPLKAADGRIRLRVLVDRTTVEIFANDGAVYMPVAAIAPQDNRSVAIFARGGQAEVTKIDVRPVKPIWNQ
ncbi:MAG: GH32 C-terminal domain-containing protein, partial [Armatimonadetes bacterium]|nr:GH32 C-terminal domain-containing protein [Armatimonadota bacterium]